MTKKKETNKNAIGATIKIPEIKVHCGDCLYFQREKTFEKPCAELGILTDSLPCTRFAIDVFQVAVPEDEKPPILQKVKIGGDKKISALELLGKLRKSDLVRLAALAVNEANSRKKGFQAGQEVYIQIMGTNSNPYLNCFLKAWVINATRKQVFVRGQDKEFNGYCTLEDKSVLTVPQWKKLKKKLISAGKINMPRTPRVSHIKKKEIEEHEPKTLQAQDGIVLREFKNYFKEGK